MTEESGCSLLLGPSKDTSGICVQFLQYKVDTYETEQVQDRSGQGGEGAVSCEKVKELVLFSLEKEMSRRDLTAVFKPLREL